MSFTYKETMVVNITEYLNNNKNSSIKKILDILDIVDMSDTQKKKLRQVILDELNGNYIVTCKVLAYVQERDNVEIK